MKKILIGILILVFLNFSYASDYDEKVKELIKNETITIEDREALINFEDWEKFSDEEKKELLEAVNNYTRKHIKKSVYLISERETRVKLAEIGVMGIDLYEAKLERQED